jgi:hypothetical protein
MFRRKHGEKMVIFRLEPFLFNIGCLRVPESVNEVLLGESGVDLLLLLLWAILPRPPLDLGPHPAGQGKHLKIRIPLTLGKGGISAYIILVKIDHFGEEKKGRGVEENSLARSLCLFLSRDIL